MPESIVSNPSMANIVAYPLLAIVTTKGEGFYHGDLTVPFLVVSTQIDYYMRNMLFESTMQQALKNNI